MTLSIRNAMNPQEGASVGLAHAHRALVPSGEDAAIVQDLRSGLPLTEREGEVMLWVSRGKTSPEMGEILGISPRTVAKHLEQIYRKVGVETRAAAAVRAIQAISAVRRL